MIKYLELFRCMNNFSIIENNDDSRIIVGYNFENLNLKKNERIIVYPNLDDPNDIEQSTELKNFNIYIFFKDSTESIFYSEPVYKKYNILFILEKNKVYESLLLPILYKTLLCMFIKAENIIFPLKNHISDDISDCEISDVTENRFVINNESVTFEGFVSHYNDIVNVEYSQILAYIMRSQDINKNLNIYKN